MQTKISTRHGNISDETRAAIGAKVERLTRYFERLTEIDITIDLEHRDQPRVDLKVSAEHKNDFVASVDGVELMAGIDQAIHKLEHQLRRYKEKIQDRHRGSTGREVGEIRAPRPASE